MKAGLRFNICGLETSYLRSEDVEDLDKRTAIPDHLVYACQFWSDHLEVVPVNEELLNPIRDFMYGQLLYWLEVLGLIGGISTASPALLKAAQWSRVSHSILWDIHCKINLLLDM
jgi:hypothetical protein